MQATMQILPVNLLQYSMLRLMKEYLELHLEILIVIELLQNNHRFHFQMKLADL